LSFRLCRQVVISTCSQATPGRSLERQAHHLCAGRLPTLGASGFELVRAVRGQHTYAPDHAYSQQRLAQPESARWGPRRVLAVQLIHFGDEVQTINEEIAGSVRRG
jgi:hypothetical protein